MKREWRFLFGLIYSVTCPLYGDQITLQNGDRITGTVVKKDAKILTFESDVFGIVEMPWSKVQSLTTDKPVFVELPDKQTVMGTIQSNEDRLEVATPDTRHDTTLAALVAIRNSEEQEAYERLQDPPWTRLWAGSITLGWAGARGNAKALTFTTGMNAARVTSTDKASAKLHIIRATALVDGISATTAQAVRGGWGYERNIATRFVWNTFNDYEYDRFQNLDLRFVLGGGLGYVAWKNERGRLDIQAGGAYDRESFSASETQGAFMRDSGETYVGNEFTLKLSSVTSMYQNSRFFSNLTRAGEYRFNGDFGANTKLTRWLTWNIAISDRYLSNPVPGRQKHDFLYTTGIGVEFSH
jgi:hypothetical protein